MDTKTKEGKEQLEVSKNNAQEQNMVDIYIMGKKYTVPAALTIMKAFEYAGYTLVRGCGCRAGFCGACATVYRLANDYRLYVGLACQTKVEPDMYLAQIPFFPFHEFEYDLEELEGYSDDILEIFPEVMRCIACNSCTKVCPQDIKVMKYINHVIRGEVEKAADESFDCVMCGLCASRCPAHIVHYQVALLARRLYGKYLAPPSPHLKKRVEEIQEGKFDGELDELTKASVDELKKRYNNRDFE